MSKQFQRTHGVLFICCIELWTKAVLSSDPAFFTWSRDDQSDIFRRWSTVHRTIYNILSPDGLTPDSLLSSPKECTDGRSTLTSLPNFLGCIVYQIFLPMVLRWRALCSRESSSTFHFFLWGSRAWTLWRFKRSSLRTSQEVHLRLITTSNNNCSEIHIFLPTPGDSLSLLSFFLE